jgi:hypothetical protein
MEWFVAHSAGILRGSMVNADDTTQLIWIKYMAMANEAKDPDSGRLEFAKGQPYPIEYIAMICRKTVDEVLLAEEHFMADLNRDGVTPRVMIEEDGTRVLSNWKHYQRRRDGKRTPDPAELIPTPAPLTNAERKAKQEVAAIELGYKFPEKAQQGIDRKQFDKDQQARLKLQKDGE